MQIDWTPAALRALEAARQDGNQAADAVHLLQALFTEEEGRPAQLLAAAGITLAKVRSALENVDPSSSASLGAIEIAARQLARTRGSDRSVGTEHLLISAIQCDPGIQQTLVSAGLVVAELEAAAGLGEPGAIAIDELLEFGEASDRIDLSRIVDANANRAREAMRVIEDYCRFVLGDEFLTRELKSLRHDLTEACRRFEPLTLLTARDTLADVGTMITTDAELRRFSISDVIQAGFKRLQESLRSLEEHGKVMNATLGPAFEQMRYRAYTLERATLVGAGSRQRLRDCRLCAILTAANCAASLDFVIAESAAGGVDMVQLREKCLPDRELLDRARKVRRWTRDAGVLFIMNDRPDLARLADADGVHLGQDDMPVHQARRIGGPDAIIGVSTHNIEQVRRAVLDGADYIGIGPVFPSSTKEFTELAGLDFVRAATAETTLPAFALGGITCVNVDQVIAAGATRIAVSSELCGADEPRPVAEELRAKLNCQSSAPGA